MCLCFLLLFFFHFLFLILFIWGGGVFTRAHTFSATKSVYVNQQQRLIALGALLRNTDNYKNFLNLHDYFDPIHACL